MSKPLLVRRAAVLGAGVMGAQIAAHLANAGIPVLLFELPADRRRNANAERAIGNLGKIVPAPLALPDRASHIVPCNYDEHLPRLAECELIIEAISERMDWKADLYRKVAPHLGAATIFATNTSGLSIDELSESLPPNARKRFCGVHFFNPPRYMHLLELVPGAATEADLLDALETFLVTALGKGVVRAKDTPNFIGNRVGVFSLLAVMHHAERLGLGFDVADALTGPLIGRPRSATFRTADVVGLDTFAHVVNTMRDGLPHDPWRRYYAVPAWMGRLIEQGALGQKTRKGVYRKVGDEIRVLDRATGEYRALHGAADETVAGILKEKDVAARFARLRECDHVHAQLLWSVYRDTFHYCACHLAEIAHTARDVDFALRWGFAWERGPFETWQAAGWPVIARAITDDIASGAAMANVALPPWAVDPKRDGVHTARGSFSPDSGAYEPRSPLPVYARQPFPDRLLGEPVRYGDGIFQTAAVRCWHTGDGIAVLTLKTRLHLVDDAVLEGILRAIDEAERGYAALVIWSTEPPFSAGADLKVTSVARVERLVERFQQVTQAIRYAMVAVVAAVDGMALGGGCELAMMSARIVATLESYPGLVESGLGLIPAGGGCKELALRAAQEARGGDLFAHIERYFRVVAAAEVACSALHAQTLGYFRAADRIVMNRHELLYVAKSEARALSDTGYRPPLAPAGIRVAGRGALANLKAYLVNLLEGGRISEHDCLVGTKLATVLCGGDVDAGSVVDEQWLLDLERRHFVELAQMQKTQARIAHMLKTGKPLRN
jgi:3-hydroxyacyl-CoA dehydrogenase